MVFWKNRFSLSKQVAPYRRQPGLSLRSRRRVILNPCHDRRSAIPIDAHHASADGGLPSTPPGVEPRTTLGTVRATHGQKTMNPASLLPSCKHWIIEIVSSAALKGRYRRSCYPGMYIRILHECWVSDYMECN